MKKILIIFSNPDKKSFGTSLGKSFIEGLKYNKHKVKELYLYDLNFDLREKGNIEKQILEEDIKGSQKLILWADHIVFCYPIWWYNFPAVLKGFFDRTLQSGFAFEYKTSLLPDKLLKGKTAEALVTMDAPPIFYKFVIGAKDRSILKNMLAFCGVKVISHNYFGSVRKSSDIIKKKWLNKSYKLGLRYK